MAHERSYLVTLDDLKYYFKELDEKGRARGSDKKKWSMDPYHDSGLFVYGGIDKKTRGTDGFDLMFNPKGMNYFVEVSSTEDSVDSDSTVTDAPLKFIADFLGTGTEGDEIFKKMAFSPDDASYVLTMLAVYTGKRMMSKGRLAANIKRLIIALSQPKQLKKPFNKIAVGIGSQRVVVDAINKLAKEASDKGWDSKINKQGEDLSIDIKIHDEYEAKITVESMDWQYGFTYRDPESGEVATDDGVTTDPIEKFEKFRRKANKLSKSDTKATSDTEAVSLSDKDVESGQHTIKSEEGKEISNWPSEGKGKNIDDAIDNIMKFKMEDEFGL